MECIDAGVYGLYRLVDRCSLNVAPNPVLAELEGQNLLEVEYVFDNDYAAVFP